MTTKAYGVDMEVLQKLYQFQFLLKKIKFGIVDKMVDFIAYVQLHTEKEPIPAIQQLSVAHGTIFISYIQVPKYTMAKIEANPESNKVVIKFKMPLWGIGNFICLDVATAAEKNDFLTAVGLIDSDESDAQEITPPSSADDSN